MKRRIEDRRPRLLPSPLLSVFLFLLWLLLNRSVSPGHLLIAGLVAVAVPITSRALAPPRPPLRRPGTALRLLAIVLWDIVVSNLRVARGSLMSPWRKPITGFVTLPLALRDPNALAVLAIIVSGVPGTVWCELAPDASELTLHVFDLDDPDAFVSAFKARYERPLLEIFG
jgi:multicomponent K+:H+ antiporter subunit E